VTLSNPNAHYGLVLGNCANTYSYMKIKRQLQEKEVKRVFGDKEGTYNLTPTQNFKI
jgi:hypothetical protein